jgi:endonuclease VIII
VPEGHVVHRQAKEITKLFGQQVVQVDSPQGRFTDSAALVNGAQVTKATAQGKHLFIGFNNQLHIHVHLGLYGKWAFHAHTLANTPDPVGLIRLRIITDSMTAELRGPNACTVVTTAEKKSMLAKIGPDPIVGNNPAGSKEKVLASRTAIGTLLMDQRLFAGVGNIYRAEVLFRHQVSPFLLGRELDPPLFDVMWDDLRILMKRGVRTGRIDTVRPEHEPRAMKRAAREDRHGGEVYVYRRDGQECFVCGSEIQIGELQGRNLFWCPTCQG